MESVFFHAVLQVNYAEVLIKSKATSLRWLLIFI